MANYTTSQDLINTILDRVGEVSDGNSDFQEQALTYLNRAYQSIASGATEFDPSLKEDWFWLRGESSFVAKPSVTDGTVAVVQSNNGISFSSAPTESLEGWHIRFGTHPDVFIISSHSALSTNATLDQVYTGDTAAASEYTAFKLRYDLASDFMQFSSVPTSRRQYRICGYTGIELDVDSIGVIRERFPLQSIRSASPTLLGFIGESTVELNTFPESLYRISYSYTKRPNDLINDASDIPEVPRQWRHVLADAAQFLLFTDKSDNRADGLAASTRNILQAMAEINRKRRTAFGKDNGHIYPGGLNKKSFGNSDLVVSSNY